MALIFLIFKNKALMALFVNIFERVLAWRNCSGNLAEICILNCI
jgi:hypothetical protein